MKRCKAVISIPLVVLLIALASQCLGAISVWATRPGTVGNALSADVQDGASVYLDAVIVDKIQARKIPHYFTVRECFDSKSKIVIYIPAPAELRHGQTIDVTGVLTRLPDGKRAIGNASVFAYLSEDGDILYHGPLIKGLLNPTPWPYKANLTATVDTGSVSSSDPIPPGEPNTYTGSGPIYCATIAAAKAAYNATERILVELQCRPLQNPTFGQFTLKEDNSADSISVYYTNPSTLSATDRINKIVGIIQKGASNNYWIEVNSGPNWQSQDVAGSVQTAPEGSIAWIKTFADTTALSTALVGKVVSRVFPGQGYFYIQEATRMNGVRVADSTAALSLHPGDIVTIRDGEVATVDGERVINSTDTEFVSSGTAPTTLGLINKALGGGNYNIYTFGPVGGSGLHNVGLLVRSWGKITSVGQGYFYADDGSGTTDGTDPTGVRVVGLYGYQPYVPAIGDYVAITGISGLGIYDQTYGIARTVRVSSSSDITIVKSVGPPTGVQVQATGVDQNNLGKITVYWQGVPGATGYNVYRGATSGGENYNSPINGVQPVTTPTFTGGNKYAFTDTGLTFGQEYFYTVKAIRSSVESAASHEDSDIPDDWAIPWDSDDAYIITEAVRQLWNPSSSPNLIRAVGPDGTVYCSTYGVLRPGSADMGSLEFGTNVLRYPSGAALTIPDDSGMLGGVREQGMQAMLQTTEANESDGPYRRVRSIASCTASYANFAPGWRIRYICLLPTRTILIGRISVVEQRSDLVRMHPPWI